LNISGWLFDAYTLGDRMVFWVITEQGQAVRLEDSWTHSFYVASDNRSDLEAITRNKDVKGFVKSFEFVSKYETIVDRSKSKVLKVTLVDSRKAESLADRIWQLGSFGQYRLYNADLTPAQSYLYEHDLFPLAFCKVESANSRLKWHVLDDIMDTDYDLPDFRTVRIDVKPQKQGRLARFTDRIESISIRQKAECIEIKKQSEADTIAELILTISDLDPDFIFMQDGDSFGFPYLVNRAAENDIDLLMSREKIKLAIPSYEGTSYLSYGKVYFKPATITLLGRIHLDSHNSFVWKESGMHGFYEVARVCRMPLHAAFRASIGKCLSSLQFYFAAKNDILIPWKPDEAEHFKTLEELLLADRGGLILVPEIGVHERVAEFDFAALFPNIMYKRNVSAETVRCDCCSSEEDNRVPELGINICSKRDGIVKRAMEIVVKKRAMYKKLKKEATDPVLRAIYDSRQCTFKWIGVTSFGYLGFNNAKFGRIDSHQAVCAYDREILAKSVRIAEEQGYRILHGIVDSLWVQKDATKADYLKLKEAIEEGTGFEISFEGEYKWIAFLASKRNSMLPVPNRYFGTFQDGTVKVRGLEARRHDTPPLFVKFQTEILEVMAQGDSVVEVKTLMPRVQDIFQKYVLLLKQGKVLVEDLVFTKQLSKNREEYHDRNTIEHSVIEALAREGEMLRAGETVRYVIVDNRKSKQRALPVELLEENTTMYDARRYVELLARVCNSVTEPFGYVIKT
jgi:DNA polymerase-2